MSILAKLLNKKEESQDSGQIPPGLIKSVASKGKGNLQRRTYLLIAAGGVAAVAGGFLLVIYLQNRPVAQPQISVRPVARPQHQAQPAIQLPVSSASTSAATATSPAASKVKQRVAAAKIPSTTAKTKRARRHAVSDSSPASGKPKSSGPADTKQPAPHKDRATVNAYLFAARTAESKREYIQALNLYRQALKADPGNYQVMNNIASTLLSMGQYDEALVNVIRALTLKGDYVSALVNGGIAYSKRGDYESALKMFSKSVELEPDNKAALYNLALSQEKRGRLEDALLSFRRLANHGDVQGNLGMARIQEKKGNRSEALRLYLEIAELPEANNDTARKIARKRILILEQER